MAASTPSPPCLAESRAGAVEGRLCCRGQAAGSSQRPWPEAGGVGGAAEVGLRPRQLKAVALAVLREEDLCPLTAAGSWRFLTASWGRVGKWAGSGAQLLRRGEASVGGRSRVPAWKVGLLSSPR